VALNDLATVADLTARGIDGTALGAPEFLAAAQTAVRDAAGVPITRETFTATVAGWPGEWLPLPGQPVTVVTDVLIDTTPVSDWKLVGGELWRPSGWELRCGEPANVTATITGGLVVVPEDIVDMVCALVGMALAKAAAGDYASRGDLTQLRIDDYSEGYGNYSGAARLAGPLELPPATRNRLRARFGGGTSLLRSR